MCVCVRVDTNWQLVVATATLWLSPHQCGFKRASITAWHDVLESGGILWSMKRLSWSMSIDDVYVAVLGANELFVCDRHVIAVGLLSLCLLVAHACAAFEYS